MQKILITIGVILILIGLLYPWIKQSGIGRLPGDIFIKRENFTFYFPLTTSIILSLLLAFILWILRK